MQLRSAVCVYLFFITMLPLAFFVLAVASAAANPPPQAGLLPVADESLQLPLRAVGQLSNGCTGYLIGPCHVRLPVGPLSHSAA